MLLILLFLLLPLVHPTSQGGSSSDAAGGSNQGDSANPFLQDPETIRAMAVQKAVQRATQQGKLPTGIPDRAQPNGNKTRTYPSWKYSGSRFSQRKS